ncbi:MAG: hypothetical protein ACRYFR_20845 [Janthinobacterium lividum]
MLSTKGQPFFAANKVRTAAVTYGGHTYANVPLRYDLVRGQLVLTAPGGGREMTLLNEQVTRFVLDGHSFIRLAIDSIGNAPLRAGFYDLLVEGPVRLLALRRKTFQKRATNEGMESEITASDAYFVGKDRRYYPVDKAAELLRLFPDDKAALRDYIQNNHLNFKAESREQALVALVRYQATLARAGH